MLTATHHPDPSSSMPFGLVWQPRQGNRGACDLAGPDVYFVARTSRDGYVVVVVAAAAVDTAEAAAAMANRSQTLAADFGGEDATSMDSVVNEAGQRTDRGHRLKVKEEGHANGSGDVEAWRMIALADADEIGNEKDPIVPSLPQSRSWD